MSNRTSNLILGISLAVIVISIVIAVVNRKSDRIPTADSPEATLSLVSPKSGTIEVGQIQSVRWDSENYLADTVKVSLIRKVSENPDRYELIRTVADATSNDGEATWVPAVRDTGENLFIEIGCALTDQACRASLPIIKLAVINTGRFQNTANTYEAIEQLKNK